MKTPKLKPMASAFGALLLSALSAFAAPVVTSPTEDQPLSSTDGKPVTLSVTAESTTDKVLAYEWFKDNVSIFSGMLPGVTGQATNTLKISKATKDHAGVYRCRVFEPGDPPILEENSPNFTLTVNVRPVITKTGNPAPATKTQEESASFTVTLDANTTTDNLVIQWQKNNVDIDPDANPTAVSVGSLTSTFTIPTASVGPPATPGVQVTDIGNYRAKIVSALTNTTIYSKAAALKVNSAPVVLKHPAADTGGVLYIAAKASGKLGVTVGGNSPFKYQWKKQTTGPGTDEDVLKATAAALTLKGDNNVEGFYRVSITNPYTKPLLASGKDATLSNYAQVVVLNKVTEATPISVNSNNTPNAKGEYPAGSTFTLTVNPSDTDTGVLEYQWQKDGKNIADSNVAPNIVAGTTQATLNLTPLHWVHRGVYRCIVKNNVGVLTTKTFTLKVDSPPVILTPPPALVVAPLGGSATLNFVAGGNVPLKYQWFKVGMEGPFSKETASPKLVVSCKLESAEGDYYCVIKNTALNASQQIQTDLVHVRVDTPVKIGLQPQSGSVTTGSPLILSVETSQGDPDITFQWQKNGKNISDDDGYVGSSKVVTELTDGKAKSELTIPVDASTAGSYRCIVSNVNGLVKVTSATAKVIALLTPFIIQQPEDKTVFVKGSASFTVKAGGTPTLKYQWVFTPSAIGSTPVTLTGKTAATLSLTNVEFNQAGTYHCLVSNATSVVAESDAALLVVNAIPLLEIDEITPKKARTGDKVRITGEYVKQFVKTVKIGGPSGVTAAFVKEAGDSILITVPATAPLTASPITLININDGVKTSEEPITFTRSSTQTNDRNNPTIIVGTNFPVQEGATTAGVMLGGGLPPTGFAEAVYEWVAPKAGTYYVQASSLDNTFQIGLDVSTIDDSFSVNYFPSTSQVQSVTTSEPNMLITFRVYGQVPYGELGGQGLKDFGSYRLTCDFAFGPQATSSFTGTSGSPVAGSDGWSQEGSSGTANLVQVSEYNEAASLTGSSSQGAEPTVLWKDTSDVEVGTSSIVHTEWTMSIDQAGTGTGGYFGWQVTGADGSPLAQLQFSVADGSVSLVQPDGNRTMAEPSLVPGSSHRFEIITDLGAGTWQARMDGAVLGEPLPLPAKSGFGDVSAIWFPAASGGAQPTMTFDDVTISVD